VKHEGQLVAQLNPDGSKLYIHSDHEGSSTVITNSSGNIIENTTYSPFGEVLSGGTASRFDSEGKEFDSVVGDYDFNFRKMNPSWGFFLQPDTLIPNVYDPQSLNRYMFERGNPYGKTDPTGHMGAPGPVGGPDPVGVAKYGFSYLAIKIEYAYLSFKSSNLDKESQAIIKNHAQEANKALGLGFLNSVIGGIPGEGDTPEGEVFPGINVQVGQQFCEDGSACLKEDPINREINHYFNVLEKDKIFAQSNKEIGGHSAPILYNIISKNTGNVFAKGLTQNQLTTISKGGSAKSTDGSTITTVNINSQTVYVKITPIKDTKNKK